MSLYCSSVTLVAVLSLFSMVTAPGPQFNPLAGNTALATGLGNLNPAVWFSLKNVIGLHTGCYKVCWFISNKDLKQDCYTLKRQKCMELRSFRYKAFIAYHAARIGAGKMASTVVNMPGKVVGSTVQAGTQAVTTMGKGGVAVATTVGQGGVAVVTGAGNAASEVGQFTADTGKKTVNVIGGGAKAVGGGVAQAGQASFNGLETGITTVGGGMKKMGGTVMQSPGRLFGGRKSGSASESQATTDTVTS